MKGMSVTAWNGLWNVQACLVLNYWITPYNSIQETHNVFFCGIHREIVQLLVCLLPASFFWVHYWCHSRSNYNIDCTVGMCTCGKKVQIHRMVWNVVFYLIHHSAEIPQDFECMWVELIFCWYCALCYSIIWNPCMTRQPFSYGVGFKDVFHTCRHAPNHSHPMMRKCVDLLCCLLLYYYCPHMPCLDMGILELAWEPGWVVILHDKGLSLESIH